MSATEMRTGSDARSSPAEEQELPADPESQVVHRQVLLREVNERISEIAGGFELTESFSILCECGSGDCHGRFELTRAEYEHIRRTPTHFAVFPGHHPPGLERVIQEHEGFVTVKTFG